MSIPDVYLFILFTFSRASILSFLFTLASSIRYTVTVLVPTDQDSFFEAILEDREQYAMTERADSFANFGGCGMCKSMLYIERAW